MGHPHGPTRLGDARRCAEYEECGRRTPVVAQEPASMSEDKPPSTGFVSVGALKGTAPRSPAEIIAEIRRIYFKTTKQTVLNDLAHAIELLKALPDEESREKAHVYMEGIAQMRNDWLKTKSDGQKPRSRKKASKGSK
jgi:hypothetical protein